MIESSMSSRTIAVSFVVTLAPGAWGQGDSTAFDAARPNVIDVRADGSRVVRGEVLVGLVAWSDRERVLASLRAGGARLLGQLPERRVLRLEVPAGTEASWIEAATVLDGVAYAEPNGVGEGGGSPAPNDTFFGAQWHHRNTGQSGGTPGADIEVLGAWGIQQGSSDVVVAVLDSGIDFTNPEFVGRLLPGHDFVAEDNDPTFDHTHGVLVTGLLAANAGNGFGVAGVDRNCTVLPVKVLDQFNGGTVVDLVQGIDYSVTQGVDIISMSLINYPASATLVNSLAAAHAAGVILVACGGNFGIGNADVTYPGASPFTISIGWTDHNDVRSSSSGTGTKLDFVAPGVSVRTVNPNGSNSTSNFSGCSAATPVAAGIVALLKGQNPALTQDQIYDLLVAGAEDQVGPASQDTPGKDSFYGHGRLSAFASLQALCGCSSTQPFLSSPQTIPVAAGGTQLLRLDVGGGLAGSHYIVLGSASGTSPGLPVGSSLLPLNYDVYFDFLLVHPNTLIASSFGVLDGAGKAESTLTVPAATSAALAGLTLHHAALIFTGVLSESSVQLATNAAQLTLVP